jgi:two-component system cell cycle sensor histidine kinase/response regulator CckA
MTEPVPTESLRLFLVEDNEDIALLMRRCLERAGHEVVCCRTAADALIVLGHSTFHLVLLDHILPDRSGLDLLQDMKREGIVTPVLVVTAYGDEQLATQVLRSGALDYIAKDQALTFLAELPKRVSESVNRHRLEDMNRLLIASLESARDGVMITDLQGHILHVNQALEGMSGYCRDEMKGRTPRMFRSDHHPPEFYAGMWQTILKRNSWQGELVNRRKDGTILDTSLTISPILDNRGQLTHFVGIYRDVSERKLLERQLLQAQKMQSIGTLAGGIAHEFNNLLAGIQGYAALGVREPNLDDTTREYLDLIIHLTDRAAHLTRQLLAFARKPALSRQPTDIARLLQNTADLIKHTLSSEVELSVSLPQDGSFLALADANQMQQVLVNLAINARDALSARQHEDKSAKAAPISLDLYPVHLTGDWPAFPDKVPAGEYLVLQVRDSGIGMSQEVLSQALDPFFTTKGVGQGTGLGLPVAFGIVHGHQGFLTVDSAEEKGTCVRVYLPRLPDSQAATAMRQVGPLQILDPEKIPSRHILIVDDEDAVLDVVTRFLEIVGHRVTCFSSGKEVCEYLQKGLPADLVFLDLMIPKEEGTKNYQNIRELRPELPILLCTGLLQEKFSEDPVLSESRFLRKPFRMNELWHVIHEIFAAR